MIVNQLNNSGKNNGAQLHVAIDQGKYSNARCLFVFSVWQTL